MDSRVFFVRIRDYLCSSWLRCCVSPVKSNSYHPCSAPVNCIEILNELSRSLCAIASRLKLVSGNEGDKENHWTNCGWYFCSILIGLFSVTLCLCGGFACLRQLARVTLNSKLGANENKPVDKGSFSSRSPAASLQHGASTSACR